jgi:hypothetical protein
MNDTKTINLLTRNVVVKNPYFPECKKDGDFQAFVILKPKDNPHDVNTALAEALIKEGAAELWQE